MERSEDQQCESDQVFRMRCKLVKASPAPSNVAPCFSSCPHEILALCECPSVPKMQQRWLSNRGIEAANWAGWFLKPDVGIWLLTGFDFLEGAEMGRMFRVLYFLP